MRHILSYFLIVVTTILGGLGITSHNSTSPESQQANVVSSVVSKPTTTPTPSQSVGVGTTTTVVPPKTTSTLTKSEVKSIVDSTLDSYVKSGKFRGPKGDRGEDGKPGANGQNGSSGITTSYTTPTGVVIPAQNLTVSYTPPGASNPGSIGNITYFASKELTTDKLTVNDTANINKLNVTGASTFSSLLTNSILPQTAGSVTEGVVTTEILTANPNGSGGGGLYNDSEKMMGVGTDGFVRFVYFDNHFQDVHFVRCLDADCVAKNNTVVASNTDGIDEPVIDMGSDGYFRIAYIKYETPNELHFIKCSNDDCSSKTDNLVDTGSYYEISLSLDSSDKAYIAYNDYTNSPKELKLAVCSDNDCSSSANSIVHTFTGTGYTDVSIQVASDGFPRIVYLDKNSSEAHYISCTSINCSTQIDTLLTSISNPYYVDMVLGQDGYARIVYQDHPTAEKFIQCTDRDCTTKNITTLDSTTSGSSDQISIVMGNDGFPRILYDYYNPGSVHYVSCTNDSCSTKETKLITSSGGYPTSLTLGLDGFARILYLGTEDYKTLYIARLKSESGSNVYSGSDIGSASSKFNNIYSQFINGDTINATSIYLNGSNIASSLWGTLNNNAYFNTGYVGIGTTSPTGLFQVSDQTSNSQNYMLYDSSGILTLSGNMNTGLSMPVIKFINWNGQLQSSFGYNTNTGLSIQNNFNPGQTAVFFEHSIDPNSFMVVGGTNGYGTPTRFGFGMTPDLGKTIQVQGASNLPTTFEIDDHLHTNIFSVSENGEVKSGYKRTYSFTRLGLGGNAGDTVNIGSVSRDDDGKIFFTLYIEGGTCDGGTNANAKYTFIGEFSSNTNGWQELAPEYSTRWSSRYVASVDVNKPAGSDVQIRIRQPFAASSCNLGYQGVIEVYGSTNTFTPDSTLGSGGTVTGQYDLIPLTQVNGFVGIATTSPWRKLSVTGTLALDGLSTGPGAGTLCLSASKEVLYSAGATCTVSSAKFKHDISTSTTGLELISKLRPVTFFYNDDIGVPGEQYGFIAEEVEQLDPKLVVHDKDNKPFSVKYENMTAILAKAIQEQQTEINQIKASTTGPIIHDSSSLLNDLQYYSGQILTGIWHFVEIVTDKITATLGVFKRVESDEVQTKRFCVGDSCVTEAEFKALLEKNSISQNIQSVIENNQSADPSTSTSTSENTNLDSNVDTNSAISTSTEAN